MSRISQYRFGPFRFDAEGRVLFRGQQDLGLPPKASDVLLLLLTRAGSVVDKTALLDTVWAGRVVGEGSLTRAISILRKALGGEDASRAYVATVSRRGYRFVAPLDAQDHAAPASERVMLAVLPFANAGSRRGHDFFTDGLTEEISHSSRPEPGAARLIRADFERDVQGIAAACHGRRRELACSLSSEPARAADGAVATRLIRFRGRGWPAPTSARACGLRLHAEGRPEVARHPVGFARAPAPIDAVRELPQLLSSLLKSGTI